jgi:ABC-type Mn2+/Zn2+ transport system ATPase subunit
MKGIMARTILEMRQITKDFAGVKALDGVDLSVVDDEIHALVGENGAGKSTLMNVLSGVYPHGTYEGILSLKETNAHSGTSKIPSGWASSSSIRNWPSSPSSLLRKISFWATSRPKRASSTGIRPSAERRNS